MSASCLLDQPVDAVSGAYVKIRGRWVLSFASTDYLGLAAHPAVKEAACRAARRHGISLGSPRIIAGMRIVQDLEACLASLVRAPAAVVFASTTHAVTDALRLVAGRGDRVFLDAWAYPTSLDAARLVASHGASLEVFTHDDHAHLRRLLEQRPEANRRVVVIDGVYSAGGSVANGRLIAKEIWAQRGYLLIDDAHGVGVLGKTPCETHPLGLQGGGTPSYLGIAGERLIHVAGLAKGFGVPLAFVAGSAPLINDLCAHAESLTHNSPPAIPLMYAARTALEVHASDGPRARQRLVRNVRRFRSALVGSPVHLAKTLFPIQSVYFDDATTGRRVADALLREGVLPVLQLAPPDYPNGAALRFVITARHTEPQIAKGLEALRNSLVGGDRANPAPGTRRRHVIAGSRSVRGA